MDRARRRPERRAGRQHQTSRIDDSRLRSAGVIALCLKLALVPLVFDHSADVPFVLPKALLSHGLTYVLVAVLVGLVVMNGPGALVPSKLHVAVLAYVGVNILAAAFAVNHTLAFFGTHVRMMGLSSVADGAITFLAAAQLIRTRREVIAVAASILTPAAVVIVYELVQLAARDPLSWSIDGSQRPFSTLGQPTTLALYLTILAALAFATVALVPGLGRAWRGGIAAYAAVLLLAAGLTGTRSVVLGVVAAGGAFGLLVVTRGRSRRMRLIAAAAGVSAAAVFGLVLIATPVGGRLLGTVDAAPLDTGDDAFGQLEESAAARVGIYRIALGIVADRPLLGAGPDNFAAGLPAHRPDPAPRELRQSIATSTHSWIMAIATSSGVLGLLAFSAILVAAALTVIRRPLDVVAAVAAIVVAAYLGGAATTVSALETDALFWFAVGAIAGADARTVVAPAELSVTSDRPRRRDRAAPGASGWIAWTLVAASLLMMATGLTALSASRDAKRSVSARAPNTAAQAIDLARRATAADPNRAEYWQQLALAYVVASRWSDASAAFQHAASLAPYDIRFLTDDIQVQFVLANAGDAQALSRASELAERAVLIDPNNPNGHLNRALIERARQDLSAAATSVARAVALDPNSTNLQLYVTAVEILVAAGKAEDAVRVGQAGVAVFGPTVRSVALRVRLAQALVAAGREPEAVAQLSIALSISPGDAAATRLLGEFPNAGQVTNAAAGVSVTPPVVERGGSITVTWTGIGRPTIGDWVGLFPADNPDTSYVAWHLTTSEPAGSVTIAVPSTASSGEFDVRLFLNYANTRIARSDRLTVR